MQEPQHLLRHPNDHPGIFWLSGEEVLGYAHYTTIGGTERVIHWITATRPSAGVRALWPEERRAKEEVAWQDLVAIDAANWRETERWNEAARAGTLTDEQRKQADMSSRMRKNAKRRYERVAFQERKQAERRAAKEWDVARAAWEAAGRICAVCGEHVVGAGKEYDLSRELRREQGRWRSEEVPVVAPIPVFGHVECARSLVLRELEWHFTRGAVDWHHAGYDSDDSWQCEVCGRPSAGSLSVTRAKTLVVIVPLCTDHLNEEVAIRFIESFLPARGT